MRFLLFCLMSACHAVLETLRSAFHFIKAILTLGQHQQSMTVRKNVIQLLIISVSVTGLPVIKRLQVSGKILHRVTAKNTCSSIVSMELMPK